MRRYLSSTSWSLSSYSRPFYYVCGPESFLGLSKNETVSGCYLGIRRQVTIELQIVSFLTDENGKGSMAFICNINKCNLF